MSGHIPVLLNEVVEALNIKPDGFYIDGTFGRGGYSQAILSHLKTGRLLALDLDDEALASNQILDDRFQLEKANFKDVAKWCERHQQKVDGLVLDLGVSSPQFDQDDRGFSYRFDGPLDMRMDQGQTLTAYQVVNDYSQEDLLRILYDYGEEKNARRIVSSILGHRPIETTLDLVEAIKSGLPQAILKKKGHPAKQTFQAIRIEVNGELDNLRKLLDTMPHWLKDGGRLVIVTFHSLEDRLVKEAFNRLSQPPKGDRRLPLTSQDEPDFRHLTRKVIVASDQERQRNPRSESAKLRILEKKGTSINAHNDCSST